MKRYKKLAAGFLGVVMALSVCSFTALAGEEPHKDIDSMDKLTAAVNAQADEQIWEITGNFDVTALVEINKNIVINGNGHTLTFTEFIANEENKGKNSFIQIKGETEVEINNLTLDGNGNVYHCVNIFGEGATETRVKLDKVEMKNGEG